MESKDQFSQIGIIGLSTLSRAEIAAIQELSEAPTLLIDSIEEGQSKYQSKLKDLDCALIARSVEIDRNTFHALPRIRCVGVAGTGVENVDGVFAREHGILVRGIADYCNRETAEFVITMILHAIRGVGAKTWRESPRSLSELKVGVVGMGRVGREVAKMITCLGGFVDSYSRSENSGLEKLLTNSDVVSLHVPAETEILSQHHFEILSQKPRVLINTCRGKIWDTASFKKWIQSPRNFAVLDSIAGNTSKTLPAKNVLVTKQAAYQLPSVTVKRNQLLIELLRSFIPHRKENHVFG